MIPTRPATDDDLSFEYDGRPYPVLCVFYYGLEQHRRNGSGYRRPRKIGGIWTIHRWGKRDLLVRTDRARDFPDFVAET